MSSRLARVATVGFTAALAMISATAYAGAPSPVPPSSTSPVPTMTERTTAREPTAAASSTTPVAASPSAGHSTTASGTAPSTASVLPVPDRGRAGAKAQGTGPKSLALAITAAGTPQPGRFFEDIGHYAMKGTVSDGAAGTEVTVYWYDVARKRWRSSGTTTTASNGSYKLNPLVGHAATIAFRATVGGKPGASGAVVSNEVKVRVRNSYLEQNTPVASVDSLKNPTVSGSVYPARPGVRVNIQVRRADGGYRAAVGATTNASGTYRASLSYGRGTLATHSVRSAYPAANRPRWEISSVGSIKRVKTLNAVITATRAAEVAKTYRSGCPVGRSKLRTITMNYLGFDKQMHRGVLIVRSNLTGKITRGFREALDAGYPIAKMKNPNHYGGNDPKQMEANNTSGFNCRKVVGNPYAQSPHSYGIAIDVNPVQNPYRDRNGRWWPSRGRDYVDRTPRRFGMLTKGSYLTTQLRREGYFWGGRWSPGRDYQHFEYRK